ncbi:MAG: DUF721 domain-containing protein [Gammaproteobacteria bacterium]|nr:DUF721 domain-containing protein [Gammaproteobacteria bacterium]NNC97338.1 DUF721 domain-containing protein [Gammaproteobacteria bacterium]NNM14930.1 DUF721 domain-containing protein [Gammaproteobacteria bacterium]
MKNKDPRSLQDILADQTGDLFSRLTQQQTQNDTLLSRIRAVLPSHFAKRLLAATYRNHILVLVAESPAWANRLRFETENIRDFWETAYSDPEDRYRLEKIVVRTAADVI